MSSICICIILIFRQTKAFPILNLTKDQSYRATHWTYTHPACSGRPRWFQGPWTSTIRAPGMKVDICISQCIFVTHGAGFLSKQERKLHIIVLCFNAGSKDRPQRKSHPPTPPPTHTHTPCLRSMVTFYVQQEIFVSKLTLFVYQQTGGPPLVCVLDQWASGRFFLFFF